MKQFFSVVLLLSCLFLLTGCDTYNPNEYAADQNYELDLYDAREEGYQNGYSDGYFEGYEKGSSEEYREAYNYGFEDAVSKAERYATSNSEWPPEDAMNIIVAFYDNAPLFDGKVPSEQEYREAVATLWHFYEYFYGYFRGEHY